MLDVGRDVGSAGLALSVIALYPRSIRLAYILGGATPGNGGGRLAGARGGAGDDEPDDAPGPAPVGMPPLVRFSVGMPPAKRPAKAGGLGAASSSAIAVGRGVGLELGIVGTFAMPPPLEPDEPPTTPPPPVLTALLSSAPRQSTVAMSLDVVGGVVLVTVFLSFAPLWISPSSPFRSGMLDIMGAGGAVVVATRSVSRQAYLPERTATYAVDQVGRPCL